MKKTSIREKPVRTWNQLNTALFAGTWDPSIRRHRSTFAYRGVEDETYKLSNGLSRLGEPYPNLERNLLKQFKKYAHDEVTARDTDWHWLAIAQHYGLPTRLLDWTYAPLVAAHFATSDINTFDRDGAIWKVDFSQAHKLLNKELTDRLNVLGAQIFSVDALFEAVRDLEEFEAKGGPQAELAVFFEPPAIDERIVNQFAYFSVLTDPLLAFDDWLVLPNVAGLVSATKIIIPSALKWEIRDKLDQSNLNERVLMTGVDGLCSWLKRHYTPRPPDP